MEKSLVSIILPVYNREKYIKNAIESALNQTYKNIELIIIDDGSKDDTFNVVSQLCREIPQAVVLKNETNLGFVKTLNKAISRAQGKYIARLDDDDVWVDNQKIEKQINFLEDNQEYSLAGGGVIKKDKDNKEITRFLLPEEDRDIRKNILISNVFAHSAVVFKKDDFQKAGGYDEEFGFFADWDLWLKIGKLGKFYNFQEFFVSYLDPEQGGGRTSHDYLMRRKLAANIKLKNKHKNFYSGYKSAILVCFANYFYSFMPLRKKIWPALFWTRNLILGPSPYKYSNIIKK